MQKGEKPSLLSIRHAAPIWAKFKAVMNNSISFGGTEVPRVGWGAGIKNGQAFLPWAPPPSHRGAGITPLAKEHTGGGRDKERQRKEGRGMGRVALSPLLRTSCGWTWLLLHTNVPPCRATN